MGVIVGLAEPEFLAQKGGIEAGVVCHEYGAIYKGKDGLVKGGEAGFVGYVGGGDAGYGRGFC